MTNSEQKSTSLLPLAASIPIGVMGAQMLPGPSSTAAVVGALGLYLAGVLAGLAAPEEVWRRA